MEQDEIEPLFGADVTHYKKEGHPFTPNIKNTIILDARRASKLDWKIEEAEGKDFIVWEMLFDQMQSTSPLDIATMHRAALEFSEKVYPRFEKESFGVILGRFMSGAEPLAPILHEIGASFPENLMVFALFDVSKIESPFELATLFSKDRYAHVGVGLKGASIPLFGLNWEYGKTYGGGIDAEEINECHAKIGICLPGEGFKQEFDAVCKALEGTDYRIFPESLFTESWHGLDQIVVFKGALDPKTGMRKCQGFTIAGGEIIYAEEIIRGRGIRTPDLLLPKQSR